VRRFECGFLSQRLVEKYFSYTYFVLLVFFVIFDLEVSLLLNMPLQGMLYKNLSYYLFFLILLSVGFFVEINKGYVEWSY
jgi:NADH:ubiquinone oxidoreductase subunit 3 (subunit A)